MNTMIAITIFLACSWRMVCSYDAYKYYDKVVWYNTGVMYYVYLFTGVIGCMYFLNP